MYEKTIYPSIRINMRIKGRILLGLNKHLKNQMRKMIQKWYLSTTNKGKEVMFKLCKRLVLDTNINKTTVFYRLLKKKR